MGSDREQNKKPQWLNSSGGDGDYLEWGRPMFDLAVEMNEKGQVYPVWGTCLGFESMTIWASQEGPTVM